MTVLIAQLKAKPSAPFTAKRSRGWGEAGVLGQREEGSKKQFLVQRSTNHSEPETQNSGRVPPIVHEVLRSSGQPLDASARAFFEPRFGHDFASVRVHNDAQAAASARAVNALAYTVGSNVVFAEGQYAPGTSAGQLMLAHELAHVVQQDGYSDEGIMNGALIVGPENDPHELEADRVAESVIQTSLPATRSAGPGRGPNLTPDIATGAVIRRVVNYLRQLSETESQPFLTAFDRSVESLERVLQNPTVPLPADVTEAVPILRSLRTAGRVTCWETSGGMNYASYDNASGQLRLHVYFGGRATNPATLMHEGIHALQAARYPGLSQMYGETLAAGGTTNLRRGVLLLKWKAWSEYWAYRRTVEYDNARQTDPAFRRDAHQVAMAESDVRSSVAAVRAERGEENFDPATWSPPAQYLARPAAGSARPRNP